MFGWLFRASCPVDESARDWLETAFLWLRERFGPERASEPVVCPTTEFFPERFDGSFATTNGVLDRIARRIGVAPDSLELRLYEERDEHGELMRSAMLEGSWSSAGAAGWFAAQEAGAPHVIGVEQSVARSPMQLVATLAHEVCHALLLGGGHLSGAEPDHEPMTDLAAIFFGYGIFTANAILQESHWQQQGGGGWSMKRTGYLTFPVAGYALALHADLRGETKPDWARHLRPDVRAPFASSLRWLRQSPEARLRAEWS